MDFDLDLSPSLQNVEYSCAMCKKCFKTYSILLEHLYWRHGTESMSCPKCDVRQWTYAAHYCNVLPYYDFVLEDKASVYCTCGKEMDKPMIMCDNPKCSLQWYHFECVGIVKPPKGKWFCDLCLNVLQKKIKKLNKKVKGFKVVKSKKVKKT